MQLLLQSRFNKNIVFYLLAALLSSFLISLALLQLFAAVLFIMWAFEKERFKGSDLILKLLLIFGAIRLLTIFTSQYFDSSIVAIQKELLFYTTGIALFFYLKIFSLDNIKRLVLDFIHAGAVVALIGWILYSLGIYDRAQSFTSGYATYSTYLLVLFVFVFSINNEKKYFNSIWLWGIEAGLILSGIILSMGRANIAIAVAAGFIIIIFRKVSLKKLGIALFFTILFTIAALQINPGESAQRMENPTTLSDRDILLKAFVELADERPFLGFGPRTFPDIFPYRDQLADKKVGAWHNEYIQIYLDSGIFALLVFLGMIALIMHRSKWVIFRFKKMLLISDIEFAVLWAIIVILLSGLTGAFLFSPVLSLLFVYLISLYSYLDYISVENEFKRA